MIRLANYHLVIGPRLREEFRKDLPTWEESKVYPAFFLGMLVGLYSKKIITPDEMVTLLMELSPYFEHDDSEESKYFLARVKDIMRQINQERMAERAEETDG